MRSISNTATYLTGVTKVPTVLVNLKGEHGMAGQPVGMSADDSGLLESRAVKRDAFRRLAERRTNAILERIRVLGNLSNPYAYEYSDEDVRQIFAAIDQELKVARSKFQNVKRRAFKLK
jgi:hypothetical protein